MSLFARMRRKRRRKFKSFINGSECIDGKHVFCIHEIPETIEYGDEFDFWIMDKKDCFLLRIEKSKEQVIHFIRDSLQDPLYCIMKIDINCINIGEHLLLLKKIGIPYRIKGQMQRKINDMNMLC
jgi:hypothetical protein